MQSRKRFSKARNDKFRCKAAKTVDEAVRLIETRLDYVATFNGVMLFRKYK